MRITAETPRRPSEDPDRVVRALRTIFPTGDVEQEAGRIRVVVDSLESIREHIWRGRILDAARRILLGGLSQDGRSARFALNKQAAYAGHLSFAVAPGPLGDIDVLVEGENLEAAFKEIAPPTLRGHPVSEEAYARHLEIRRRQRDQRVHQERGSEEE